ncbi:DUF72 domain-containing protein [Streptomyces sp. NBC_00467]|uniref:DUF72 domain-containing protein n=1 Tax=Streptomyces sp. NBC_00467 TaxID=2975752 RepID=UPI002E194068
MGQILVGTCSWTDSALLASGWYPPGRRDAEGRLRHYAEQFPVVEVDATYYALPSARNSLLWVDRTPEGFRFDVKAFSLLTGHPTRSKALPSDLRDAFARRGTQGQGDDDPGLLDEVWRRFSEAVLPLRDAGRLGTLLFQFPPWFAPGAPAEVLLDRCRKRTEGWPVAVEFRHPAWWQEDRCVATSALLRDLGLASVSVDVAANLPLSLPPVTEVTAAGPAVVRFHGRNAAWGSGTKEERFRHTYTDAELTEWLPRLTDMSRRAEQLHVLFNNCCGDAAVRAAESMERLLAGAS